MTLAPLTLAGGHHRNPCTVQKLERGFSWRTPIRLTHVGLRSVNDSTRRLLSEGGGRDFIIAGRPSAAGRLCRPWATLGLAIILCCPFSDELHRRRTGRTGANTAQSGGCEFGSSDARGGDRDRV